MQPSAEHAGEQVWMLGPDGTKLTPNRLKIRSRVPDGGHILRERAPFDGSAALDRVIGPVNLLRQPRVDGSVVAAVGHEQDVSRGPRPPALDRAEDSPDLIFVWTLRVTEVEERHQIVTVGKPMCDDAASIRRLPSKLLSCGRVPA